MPETLSYAVPSASRIMLSLPAKEPVETMTALALMVSWLPSSHPFKLRLSYHITARKSNVNRFFPRKPLFKPCAMRYNESKIDAPDDGRSGRAEKTKGAKLLQPGV